ncbi:hypothetical protein D3C80_2057420 [compost metagenome]
MPDVLHIVLKLHLYISMHIFDNLDLQYRPYNDGLHIAHCHFYQQRLLMEICDATT